MNIHCTKKDIGRKLYPVDNSYLLNLTDDDARDVRLAGTQLGEEAKLVTIVSEPYFQNIRSFGNKFHTHEFVDVEYKGAIFRVLNNFTLTQFESNFSFDYLSEL